MSAWTDADPEEDRLAGELEASLGALRSRAGHCPEPALLTAAGAGVLPDELAADVADHLRRCGLCQVLARDMADPELTAPSGLEGRRMRSRVLEAATGTDRAPDRGWSWWWWRPAAVVGTLVVVLGVGWWTLDLRRPLSEISKRVPVAAEPVPPRLALEKPAVTVPLASVLLWRSESRATMDQYLGELGSALAPYRVDDFAEAARRLETLAATHPTAEVRFYLGVCRLFLGRHDLAIADLLQARQLAQPALAQDATWYLAVAHERLGQRESVAAELRALCGEKGERQAQACEALAGFEPARR